MCCSLNEMPLIAMMDGKRWWWLWCWCRCTRRLRCTLNTEIDGLVVPLISSIECITNTRTERNRNGERERERKLCTSEPNKHRLTLTQNWTQMCLRSFFNTMGHKYTLISRIHTYFGQLYLLISILAIWPLSLSLYCAMLLLLMV